MFAEDFKKKGGLWIMKPTSRCQGQGIFIVDKLIQVAPYRFKPQPLSQTQSSTPLASKPPVPRARKEEEKSSKMNDQSSE
jgi:hypothetical protein